MEEIIQWKQGLFKRSISLHINEEEVGAIIPQTWKFKRTANIGDTAILFTVKGVFRQQGILIDPLSQLQIGEITFNFWHTKATITLNGQKVYHWQFNNLWNTHWELTGYDNTRILYQGRKAKGEMVIKQGTHLMALIGLLIPQYLNHRND